MYAGNHIINYNQNTIECRCPLCGKNEVLFAEEETIWNFVDYRKGKGLIQDIFPDKDASFREWLMTGYCESCQEMMFANPEEEFETENA